MREDWLFAMARINTGREGEEEGDELMINSFLIIYKILIFDWFS